MRDQLIKERKALNLTQKELAEELGIAEVTVRKMERGNRNPSPNMAKKFAYFYKKELAELFPDIFLIRIDTKRIESKVKR